MIKNKLAFSLIEIIISSIILTIGVFGVYKLIGNNMLLLSNNESIIKGKNLNIPFRECLKTIGFSGFTTYNSGDFLSINFGNDLMGCKLSNYNTGFSFSGINIDNDIYFLYGNILEKGSNYIKLDLNIYNDITKEILKDEENKKLFIYK